MKYFIFLDVDGVLHPLNEKHLPSLVKKEHLFQRVEEEEEAGDTLEITRVLEGEFVPEIMERLARTIKTCATNNSVHIILSSTWRETLPGRKAVDSQLKEFDIPSVEGNTPQLSFMHCKCKRAHEIVHWLYLNLVTDGVICDFRFVVLDDADLVGEETMPIGTDYAADFIRPYFVRCDKSTGLTESDCQRIVEIFGNNQVPGTILPEKIMVLINEELEEKRRLLESDDEDLDEEGKEDKK